MNGTLPGTETRLLPAEAVLNEELRSELRKRDEAIDSLRAAAAREVNDRSEFLLSASHDVRQRVHALKLIARSCLDDASRGPSDLSNLARLTDLLENLERCLGHILEFARLEGPMLLPQRRSVELQTLFQWIELQYEAVAAKRKIAFRIRTTRHLLCTDSSMLARILENLVSNAIKFSRGKTLLSARRRGTQLFIEMRDQGAGIPADEVTRVFEAFYQVRRGGEASREGVGLGLAIVKRLSDALGYRVEVHTSEAGTLMRVVVSAADLLG